VRERNVSAAARGLKDVSGDLENTADSVLGLYREEMDHPGEDAGSKKLAELSVLKKRPLGEEVGTIRRLVWVGERSGACPVKRSIDGC
jgi:hypothetical protein